MSTTTARSPPPAIGVPGEAAPAPERELGLLVIEVPEEPCDGATVDG